MATETDIAWLAGLLEGEGCFDVYSGEYRRPCIRVTIKMVDKDIIQRAATIFTYINGARYKTRTPSKVNFIKIKEINHQNQYRFRWNGANAEQVMRAVLPYMGKRRSAKILKCLNTPNLSHQPRLKEAV